MNDQNRTFELKTNETLEEIIVTILGMAPEYLDKANVAKLLDNIETIRADSKTHQVTSMLRLTEWWDKLLTASLLDQVQNQKELYCLLCFFADRAHLMLQELAKEGESVLPDTSDLITRAAALLEEPIPDLETAAEESAGNEAVVESAGAVVEEESQDDDFFSETSAETEPSAVDEAADQEAEAEEIEQVALQAEAAPEPVSPAPSLNGEAPAQPVLAPAARGGAPERLDFTGTLFDESLIYEFIEECESHLEDIESKILTLEENPEDRSLVDEVFRPVHSIKGGAGFLGVKVMQDFAHKAENLLDEVRKGKMSVSGGLTETLLEAVDVLKTMLSQLRTSADRELKKDASREPLPPVPVSKVLSYIEILLAGGAIDDLPAGGDSDDGQNAPATPSKGNKIGEILIAQGDLTDEQLDQALTMQERPLGKILVEEGLVSAEKVEDALKAQEKGGKPPRGAIKVDIEKLDELMNYVGELVIAQTLVRGSSLAINSNGAGQNIGKDLAQLGKITKEIQDRVMSLRMVPVRPVFQKMNRLVRDVSRKSGKQVQLILAGEDTELDKTVSETISDPLVHILRNSVDHGIETPEERSAAGKNPTGKVRLSAYHQGGSIVIEISDDGKGLDRERILQKAIEKGLVEEGAKLSDAQVFQMIMMPGFSTAEKITDISGRGVGMDVVRKNIERLRGKVEVTSETGVGTTVTIKLPLTLAIIDGMVVRVGSESFIVPTLSIVRSFRPEKKQISTVKGKGEMVDVRGQLMPMVRLHDLYKIQPTSIIPSDGLCVILENEEGNYALLVDELLGQQQVVIKNLGTMFKDIKGIAGGSILGDGRVGLILDMQGIYEAHQGLN